MLILFGMNEKRETLGEVSRYCSVCGRETQHTREERINRFTVYFIPVLPLGRKQLVRCNLCGHETHIQQPPGC